MFHSWLNEVTIPIFKWVRMNSSKREIHKFKFLDYTNIQEETFKSTVYLLIQFCVDKDIDKLGLIKDSKYLLSVPKIAWVEAWKLCPNKTKFESGVKYDVEISFMKLSKKTIKINKVEVK